jgi:hypothetical protein
MLAAALSNGVNGFLSPSGAKATSQIFAIPMPITTLLIIPIN